MLLKDHSPNNGTEWYHSIANGLLRMDMVSTKDILLSHTHHIE